MKFDSPAVFITSRTQSSRLPKKCLLKINGKLVIEHIIERAKLIKNADRIVLCTTTEDSDDILCEIAEKNNISYFRGSAIDKLDRWYRATRKFKVSHFVTFDADALFGEPKLNDIALNQMKKNKVDFIFSENIIPAAFTYCIHSEALKKVCKIKDTDDTEMMWTYFLDTNIFKTEALKINNITDYQRIGLRITLDYIEDYYFFVEVFNKLNLVNNNYTLLKILKFLDKNKDLWKMNYFRDIQWSENQKNKTKLKIKKKYEKFIKT